eukprot:457211-Amphidinium_carterae.1
MCVTSVSTVGLDLPRPSTCTKSVGKSSATNPMPFQAPGYPWNQGDVAKTKPRLPRSSTLGQRPFRITTITSFAIFGPRPQSYELSV